jgi:hypothetical protein
VVDAVEVGEHGNPCIGLNACYQALAAARNDHVDQPARCQHRADGCAVLSRHELDRRRRNAACGEAFHKRRMDRPVGPHCLAAATQKHGIAGSNAKRCSIGRHVWPALVNNADKADRHAHPLEDKAVGRACFVNDPAHRIVEPGHLLDCIGNRLDACRIKTKSVDHGARKARSDPTFDIAGIGLEDRRRREAKRGCASPQRIGAVGGRHQRERKLRCPPGLREASNLSRHVAGRRLAAGKVSVGARYR